MPDDPQLEDADPIDPTEHANLVAKVAALEAKAAMLEAGVDLSTPTGKMFLRAYDGAPDVDAIKTAAAEIPGALRVLEVVKDPTDDEQREPGEAEQFGERNALTTDGAAGAEDPDPKTETFGALDLEIQQGARAEDAMGNAMQRLVAAANAGDPRVLAGR